jgi:GxxExxY protein
MNDLLHGELTHEILKTFYTVYNELGYGFLERVYQNALQYELKQNGFEVDSGKAIKVYYKQIIVGEYFADLIVDKCVIVELKTCEQISEVHEIQLLNYLKATDCEVGLLLNFGRKPEFKRKIFHNHKK